jgi:hypothetical protein
MKVVKSGSGNKAMLDLIGGATGPEKRAKKPAGASLAELAGGWSKKEAREFEESVRVFEEIDQGDRLAGIIRSDTHGG